MLSDEDGGLGTVICWAVWNICWALLNSFTWVLLGSPCLVGGGGVVFFLVLNVSCLQTEGPKLCVVSSVPFQLV